MEQSEKQQRLEAEQKFQAALEQLEGILQETATEDDQTPNTPIEDESEAVDDEADIDLAALEDAVADIENYLEQKRKPK
ncbi:hypothetical protein [Anabaena azotica]|uniref:Uncharacterized protein n=1 Tax=Anabaena azotica FACHB-119 TaxID=947527 RepID=A0ABR8CYU5_9NOST|nr:hypothetical protein [Anabaena azotica]MBD2499145.1 hypothetical protein [Anabaena azotica FACHB-119]